MTDVSIEDATRFAALFCGRKDAYGTGQGRWVKQRPTISVYRQHLLGEGPGLGIAPLTDDGLIKFAAIDLDEPDFDAAAEMQTYLPGPSFLERSRSGNAHVWVFFSESIEAWIPRGILKEAILAAGKGAVEIFPKQDALQQGMVGNYINLPFYGFRRPIVHYDGSQSDWSARWAEFRLNQFLDAAEADKNSPMEWRKRADWLQLSPMTHRDSTADFGTQKHLHVCAEHLIANRDENPVVEGHRAVVYFSLAKMLLNWEGCDDDEALHLMGLVNESSPDPVSDRELNRIYSNAKRGEFTSTGCTDVLFAPYRSPDCPLHD